MGIFGKDVPGGDPTVLEREMSDPFENLLKLPMAPTPANTVIAPGMILTGSLQGEGTIHVEGKVIGEIDVKGAVLVTKNGEVEGPIATDTIQVAGKVSGNITARQQLRLESNGSIDGDITATSLTIENGGSFNGRSTMLRQQPQQAPRQSAPQAAPAPQPAAPRAEQRPPVREDSVIPSTPSSLLLDEDDDDDFPPRRG